MKVDVSKIPDGIYCNNEFGVCPHWGIRKNKPSQLNGYCSYLKRGDWMEGLSFIWDMVKECNINLDDGCSKNKK